jgi:hypothetical protein
VTDEADSEARPLYWRQMFYQQYKSTFIQSKGEISKAWWCHTKSELLSGFHSPFGGFHANQTVHKSISSEEIKNNLLNLRENESLRDCSIDLLIRTYPENVFSWWSGGQESSLLEIGFKELYKEIVHYIIIQGELSSRWNRNRMREFKGTKEFLRIHEAASLDDQFSVLSTLNLDALSKGRKFPISKEQFYVMNNTFRPQDMNLFLCVDERTNLISASAICQVIDSKSVYVYRWGVLPTSTNQRFSPITALAHHIYNFYQDLGKEILYLGTSSVKGIANAGLISFKESLGAESSYSSVFILKPIDALKRS